MTKRWCTAFFILILIQFKLWAKSGFLIVIDSLSFQKVHSELLDYAGSIRKKNNLKVYTLIDRWGVPDSIRKHIIQMTPKYDIKGMVLIGDIPIPMIRDAQHLTSAFKMDQQYPREESSVPSDRYYDDFSLSFSYLGHDEGTPLFYYSLTSDGAQRLKSDIYSGRIRPTDGLGRSRYQKLSEYLRKVVREKNDENILDEVMFFTGHGTLDESKVAAMDEKMELYEHFPWLKKKQDNHIKYIDYSYFPYIKFTLMSELSRVDLDLALLHHHGDYDTQYLNRENSSEDKMNDKALRNLYLSDFQRYNFCPSAKFVVFDACFNGAFQHQNCIANAYLFSDGRTVACMANSVNVIQDKWYDYLIGLLGNGYSVGEVNSFQPYLESHILGDPTFMFDKTKGLKKNELTDLNVLALENKYRKGKIGNDRLLHIISDCPNAQLRLKALILLTEKNSDDAIRALQIAANDKNEMVRRFAVNGIRLNGSPELAKTLVAIWMNGSTSSRIRSDARRAIEFFPVNVLIDALDVVKRELSGMYRTDDSDYANIIRKYGNHWDSAVNEIVSDTLNPKQFKFNVSCMRIYCPHNRIVDLLDYISRCNDDERRIKLIEAMGWYSKSYQASSIAKRMKHLLEDKTLSTAVRNEAMKTYKRMMNQ